MKKILTLIITCFLSLSLAGCSNSKNNDDILTFFDALDNTLNLKSAQINGTLDLKDSKMNVDAQILQKEDLQVATSIGLVAGKNVQTNFLNFYIKDGKTYLNSMGTKTQSTVDKIGLKKNSKLNTYNPFLDLTDDQLCELFDSSKKENDTYIEIYDDKNYDLIGKMYFDSELKQFVSNNGIVQFYCFDNYVYIRNFSDYGAIGKIESNQVKTFLDLPNLRIAYNGKNTQDNYYGFFLRSGKDFYLLDVYTDTLYQTNLELSQDESIRNAISDGNDICISIMNERDTETFTTKNTIMVDFDKLKKSISVLTS